MFRYILIVVAAGLLIGLVWAESTGNNWLALGFKTPLSILFVITALLQPKVFPKYFKFVFIGLILGLVGDVCLALPGLTAFRVGLAAFLAGHILYILAFAIITRLADWINPVNNPDHHDQWVHLLVAPTASEQDARAGYIIYGGDLRDGGRSVGCFS